MENLIELLKKIITNVLTALYQPFWFAVILTVFLLFFYLYAYKPIDTGKGIRAAFRAWWQEFRTSLFFRKLFLLTFFTVMILFQTLINRNMWINPLSDIMGGWWIWHTAADGTVTLTTECFENIALMLPFTALIKEIINSKKLNTQVVCIIDDNPTKHGRVLEGITIVGDRYSIPEMAKKYKVDRIIYAIPAAAADDRKAILNICKDTGCRLQTVPGVYQLVNGEVSVSRLRNVEITDLLGRAQVQVNMDEIYSSIQGKTLLVTGGGGSIGSELCRQIAASHPKKLIIFDMYENNAYEIQQEIRRKYGDSLDLEVLIGSVRNTNRIRSIMQKYKPDVVFHAAAHKHVPLMEDSPNEAIKNNVMGTYKTAVAASRAGAKKFVLISTDKAVNPTNIMGASKRLCEMVVQMMNRQCKDTDFVAVRFGNVLGSNGSVIPLFKKQIAEGGPVTVTDKNIIRYFMTIPEAVSLVLQAAHYAKGGEIFILDMGEPVRIDEMARNLIRLSGFTPDVDIKVEYTGLRPGEKLFEELLMAEEGMQETPNKLIHIGKPIEMDDVAFKKKLRQLDEAAYQETDRMKRLVAEVVPTYHPENGEHVKVKEA